MIINIKIYEIFILSIFTEILSFTGFLYKALQKPGKIYRVLHSIVYRVFDYYAKPGKFTGFLTNMQKPGKNLPGFCIVYKTR